MAKPVPKTFNAFMPLEALSAAPGGPRLPIRGIVSTDHDDFQGEELNQYGLDFSYALSRGVLNDNHDNGAGAVVGYATSVRRTRLPDGHNATVLEGFLLPTKRGLGIYETLTALEAAGNPRRLGMSLQGSYLARSGPKTIQHKKRDGSVEMVGKRVDRAQVRHVAITHEPVDPFTTVELIKSLTAGTPSPVQGGGPGAPLMGQSIQGGANMPAKLKKKEWAAAYKAATCDKDRDDLLEKGFDPDEPEEHKEPDADNRGGPSDNDADNKVSKGLSTLEDGIEALRKSFASGKQMLLVPVDGDEVSARADAIRALLGEGADREDLVKSLGFEPTIEAVEGGASAFVPPDFDGMFKSLAADFDVKLEAKLAEHDAGRDELVKGLRDQVTNLTATIEGNFAAMAKSLKIPAIPRQVQPGEPQVPQARIDADENLVLTRPGDLNKSLRVAMASEVEPQRKAAIGRILSTIAAGVPGVCPAKVTMADLQNVNITLPGTGA